MHEVVAGLLWVGNAADARDPQNLFDAEIAAVVDLAYEETPAQLPRSFAYLRIPLIDGAGNDRRLLRLAIDTVRNLLSANAPTLVACGAGMSRSPAVAAFALANHRGEEPESMLRSLFETRPHDVSLAFWEDVLKAN